MKRRGKGAMDKCSSPNKTKKGDDLRRKEEKEKEKESVLPGKLRVLDNVKGRKGNQTPSDALSHRHYPFFFSALSRLIRCPSS
jgi:hypothetical protein